MSQGQRRLAAIMFTDMVGYTALGQRNESLSLALVEEQRKLIRPVLARHNGREVKTIGDAFLVEFPSAVDAARCAYDIQRVVREFNLSLPSESRLHLRIGIHVGEVVEAQGDISGDAVNVASRIEPLAEDGGVCVTRQVFDHVRNKVDLQMSSLGPKSLKNVAEPIEIYKMDMPWSELSASSATQLDKRRIAVLPFSSLSPDPNDEYFSDGLTEELITRLSEIDGLHVIARTSVMNYKKKEKNISQIGKELMAGTIVEGSVRKAGKRIRITVQLVNAINDEHIWASTFDRNLEDIFEIQTDVASSVTRSLLARKFLNPERIDTHSLEAYSTYLHAVQLIHQLTEPSLREAAKLLEEALSIDPKFVRAYASLSSVWFQLSFYDDTATAPKKAEEAALMAIDLGPEWAEAHLAMAELKFNQDKIQEAISECEKAIHINPNLSDAYHILGDIYPLTNGLEKSLEAFEKAYELDPLSFRTGWDVAWVSLLLQKEKEALAIMEKLKELNPKNPRVYSLYAAYHLRRREFLETQRMLDAAHGISPNEPWHRIYQALLFAFQGMRKEAEGELENIRRDSSDFVKLNGQMYIEAALGNLDEAFKALEEMMGKHILFFTIKFDPFLDGLRIDRRFAELLSKGGIPT